MARGSFGSSLYNDRFMRKTDSWTNLGSELRGFCLRCGAVPSANQSQCRQWSEMQSTSLCFEMLSRLSTDPEWGRPCSAHVASKKKRSESEIRVGKWLLTTKPDDGVICGFCPLAMPSAASQLISLDLFSSGQRNGFDLASS